MITERTCGSDFFSTSSLLLLKCGLLRLKRLFKPKFIFHSKTLTLLFPCTDSRHARERSLEVESYKTRLTTLWFHLDLTSEQSHNFNRQLQHRHQTITHSGACSRQKNHPFGKLLIIAGDVVIFSGHWKATLKNCRFSRTQGCTSLKGTVWQFARSAYWLSCQELEEKIGATLSLSVKLLKLQSGVEKAVVFVASYYFLAGCSDFPESSCHSEDARQPLKHALFIFNGHRCVCVCTL